jgi:hypothetical protein
MLDIILSLSLAISKAKFIFYQTSEKNKHIISKFKTIIAKDLNTPLKLTDVDKIDYINIKDIKKVIFDKYEYNNYYY